MTSIRLVSWQANIFHRLERLLERERSVRVDVDFVERRAHEFLAFVNILFELSEVDLAILVVVSLFEEFGDVLVGRRQAKARARLLHLLKVERSVAVGVEVLKLRFDFARGRDSARASLFLHGCGDREVASDWVVGCDGRRD